ncbi:hypothetical protein Vadar_024620 [Vaccinium darrowii]|uniref:Uncharacterized protein n=1 Tax=Vaccinium darrowii TaxID=229202 RepID=A0ACB7XSV2_9ERIC|nr:hypothetical protein Vadar_024620 [Vaccinium darrowii]
MASTHAIAPTPSPKQTLKFLHPVHPTAKTLPNFLNPTKQPKTPTSLSRIRANAANSEGCDRLQEFLQNQKEYKWGFVSDVESFSIPKGLSEETIRLISKMKKEPPWMLDFRLSSFCKFLTMKEPKWSNNVYNPIDFQNICYYSEAKKGTQEEQNRLLRDFERLGVGLNKQGEKTPQLAVSAVYDSSSFATTHQEELMNYGIIFCSMSEAIINYPDLVKKYLGRVVKPDDNYYAALNSAVFSDGAFCYIPKGKKCPFPISSYFRINAKETGQFERTLIIADERSTVDYLEGCTAPSYDTNQLHAAVVLCRGCNNSLLHSPKLVEIGSAVTWKYPSVILEGDDPVGEFYSVAFMKNCQQADTETKMIHKGKNTRSRIISKGISSGNSSNCYRGIVRVMSNADNARNFSQCDSMLIGDSSTALTKPDIQGKNPSVRIEHEARTSKITEDLIFYFQQRGIDAEKAMTTMISGFCSEVFQKLPDEFGSEMNMLLSLKLENSVG